jgi:CPA2 family monovalent cation:H+ antiporter-2
VLAAEVFHMSYPLGAFFGGLVVGQSRFGPQAAIDMAPFRDVSPRSSSCRSMLFDPAIVATHPAMVAPLWPSCWC